MRRERPPLKEEVAFEETTSCEVDAVPLMLRLLPVALPKTVAPVSVVDAEVRLVVVAESLNSTCPVPVSSPRSAASSELRSISVDAMMLMPPWRVSSSAKVSILVEETLLSKSVQCAAVRQPKVALFAVAQVRTPAELVRPEPVRSVSASAPDVYKRQLPHRYNR